MGSLTGSGEAAADYNLLVGTKKHETVESSCNLSHCMAKTCPCHGQNGCVLKCNVSFCLTIMAADMDPCSSNIQLHLCF